MNKNPFVPTPTYTPPQPPLPPGPPPAQPGQSDYSAWWGASGAQQPHVQPPAAPQYNPQWSAPQAPRPPADQSALYANYGYSAQWQRQQQQQQQQQQQPPHAPYQQPQQYHPAPPVVQPPQPQPGYNPYQPTAGYPQQYVPQAAPLPAPPVAYAPPPPAAPQQPFFNPHLPAQGQSQVQRLHHTPPQHMPPAKRQRFDGPSHNRNQQPIAPPQPQFQPPPPPPPSGGSFSAQNRGPPSGPGQMGAGRGGGPGGRGGSVGGQRGRGGSFSANRGGPANRGRGGGNGYMGGMASNRGGGQSGGNARGSARQQGFGQNRRAGNAPFNNSGGFHQGGSFKNRNQGHGNQNRQRHDGGSQSQQKENAAPSIVPPTGKKEENKRTLTDFKIVGLEIPELDWSWGILPTASAEGVKAEVKDEPLEPATGVSVKDEAVDDKAALNVPPANKQESQAEATSQVTESAEGAESQKASTSNWAPRHPAEVNGSNQPPSRMRIYFDTPVTADDSKPIPHNAAHGYGDGPSDSRKGKRKKLEDDDGDSLDDIRAPPPPPQMTVPSTDDRSSVAASVAPSTAETASEGDWLMAAIVEGDEEAQAAAALQPDGEVDGADDADGDHEEHVEHDGEEEEDLDADAEGEVEQLIGDDGHGDDVYMSGEHGGSAQESTSVSGTNGFIPETGPASVSSLFSNPASGSQPAGESGVHDETQTERDAPPAAEGNGARSTDPPAPSDATVSSHDGSLFESTEDASANQPDPVSAQVPEKAHPKSLEAASAEPTLIIETQEATQELAETQLTINGHGDHSAETQPAPAAVDAPKGSQTSVAVKQEHGGERIPSPNRLSISYASGNRRLVIDSDVVTSLKLFRQGSKIEVSLDLSKANNGLKGVLVESLSESKTYVALPNILENPSEPDSTVPTFAKLTLPATVLLVAHLDSERPLSEPKWAKSGDIQEWLRNMLGARADNAPEGWEKKIHVADPDPPPTIWTVLEGWASNSPVGLIHERQRFLKTHLTETDNVLEILLRLVRGERATPFSQNAPAISAPSVSGPLLSALTPGSAHGAQQTHVSLAVLAMFRMAVDYAKRATGDKGKIEAEERMGEIIRCLPSHLIYKSLDGIFKEWKLEKKGGR